jgi:hypothetical protein
MPFDTVVRPNEKKTIPKKGKLVKSQFNIGISIYGKFVSP